MYSLPIVSVSVVGTKLAMTVGDTALMATPPNAVATRASCQSICFPVGTRARGCDARSRQVASWLDTPL